MSDSLYKTSVVNLYRAPYDVYIGRAGKGQDGRFGNPFRLSRDTPEERAAVLEKFREWFLQKVEEDPEYRADILSLKGKVLGCFCKPKLCHGDVIAEWVDSQPGEKVE